MVEGSRPPAGGQSGRVRVRHLHPSRAGDVCKKKVRVGIEETLALGRSVYNFRCYFCHGYSGDARTAAAQVLDPRPRDFTAASSLDAAAVVRTLREGRPGTAMKPFAGILSEAEMEAVAAFVEDEFLQGRRPNTAYHTPENGWPDHRRKYGAAYPFVQGEIPLTRPDAELTGEERVGKRLFLGSCITCHEPTSTMAKWESYPLSHVGQVVRNPVDAISRASLYGLHDRPFETVGLNDGQRRGKKIFDENCAFCHARDGTGKNWIGSFLEPHPRNFTDPSQTAHLRGPALRQAIRDGIVGSSMPAWRNVLTQEEIEDVAGYVEDVFLVKK
ncbi:MAG: c-type cytochrome [Alphaproteobacteria bacterium]